MAGAWRRTLRYLGLVEEDELDGGMEPELVDEPASRRPTALRRVQRSEPEVRITSPMPESSVRTIPSTPATSSGMIHRAEPKRFNEARDLGEKYKEGVPVIMNLQGTEDPIARRLVDFASGLVFGLDGKIELVANRVYLLTPREVEVSAEERERIREGGFYNQL
jgi:cell division inhibitor SepF